MSKKMIEVPLDLRKAMPFAYPSYETGMQIEEYFYDYFARQPEVITERYFLPVWWTSYYISQEKERKGFEDLEAFLATLDRSKKYFTILNFYDFGIVSCLEGLDILVFSANHPTGIPLPLLSSGKRAYMEKERTIKAGFVGQRTSSTRDLLIEGLKEEPGYLIEYATRPAEEYFNILEQSTFTLAPCGFGAGSFRLYEALHFRSIPVYVYKEHCWLPFKEELDWTLLAICVEESQIAEIPSILESISSEKITEMKSYMEQVIEEYFSLEGVGNYIIRKLSTGI